MPIGVTKITDILTNTKKIEISLEEKKVTVTFDPEVNKALSLKKEIEGAGFSVTGMNSI